MLDVKNVKVDLDLGENSICACLELGYLGGPFSVTWENGEPEPLVRSLRRNFQPS